MLMVVRNLTLWCASSSWAVVSFPRLPAVALAAEHLAVLGDGVAAVAILSIPTK